MICKIIVHLFFTFSTIDLLHIKQSLIQNFPNFNLILSNFILTKKKINICYIRKILLAHKLRN